MKKNKILAVIATLLLSCTLLTGCTIHASGRDFEIDIEPDEKETSSEEVTINDVTADSADIKNNVGTVTVYYGDDSTVAIDIDKTLKWDHEEDLADILELVKVNAEISGNELVISVENKDTGEDMWSWIEKEYRGDSYKPNLEVDLDITLPDTVKDFHIDSNVGDIKLHSLAGSFDITNNVGSVELSDVLFAGDSDVTVDVGDINCSLSTDIGEEAEISLVTNVGAIKLDTNGMNYTEQGDKDNNFVGASKTVTVKDLYEFSLDTSVGAVIIKK